MVMAVEEESFLEAFSRLEQRRSGRRPRRPLSTAPGGGYPKWTRETIIEAMRRYEVEHGTRLTANAVSGNAVKLGVPSLSAVVRRFGSWGDATLAAYGSIIGPTGQPIEQIEQIEQTESTETPRGQVKLKVLSTTKPTERELQDRKVAWTTEEPA
jgi:hypothetical protein